MKILDKKKCFHFDEKLRNQSADVINAVTSMSTGNFQPLDPYLAYISYITEPEPEINSSETTKTAETNKNIKKTILGLTFLPNMRKYREINYRLIR